MLRYGVRKEALLFLKKKKQKDFFMGAWALAVKTPMLQIQRSFLVLFFKKEPLA